MRTTHVLVLVLNKDQFDLLHIQSDLPGGDSY